MLSVFQIHPELDIPSYQQVVDRIRGAVIALRRQDAGEILVQ